MLFYSELIKCDSSKRRDVLLSLSAVLHDENLLSQVAGQHATTDCTLYMLAKDDPKLLKRLNRYINTQDLCNDVAHVEATAKLKEERAKKLANLK